MSASIIGPNDPVVRETTLTSENKGPFDGTFDEIITNLGLTEDKLQEMAYSLDDMNEGLGLGVEALNDFITSVEALDAGQNLSIDDEGFQAAIDFIWQYGGEIDEETGEILPPDFIGDANEDGVIDKQDLVAMYDTDGDGFLSENERNSLMNDLENTVNNYESFTQRFMQELQFRNSEYVRLFELFTAAVKSWMDGLRAPVDRAH